MTNKLKRFIFKSDFIRSNRVPGKRSRYYLVKQMCKFRAENVTSSPLQEAVGLLRWTKDLALNLNPKTPYHVDRSSSTAAATKELKALHG
jgi:hypothetical protein